MYDSFYGLKDRPFSMLPDPGFLYLSKKHQMALTMLEYALYNNAGFCIISGEIGAGKTTLLRKLLESMEDHISVGMITNTHSSFGELLDWVLSAYNIHQPGMNKVEMHQIFLEYLLQQYSKKKTVVLIVDEAQNMSVDTLEELRMLSNINTGKDQLLQVILAGQPELKDTLRLPELKQFAQRIAVDYHLGALSIEETFGYIRHRLKTAGATKDIFSPLACEHIHQYSGGVPRLINLLCDTSLVYGFADQAEVIDENLVDEMVRERMSDSLVPIVRPVAPETENPTPSTTSSGAPARATAPPSSKLSQISPEHKKQPVSPTTEKKTVADIRQPVAIHPHAQASGAQLKAVAAQPELDPEEQEEAVHETALANEPEMVPEASPESAVEPEVDAGSEPVAGASAEQAETVVPSSQSTQPETVKQRLVNKIEVLKIVASEPESNWFGNKWIMVVLLVLGLSVIFLMVRSMSGDSVSPPVKAEASTVSSPKVAPATPASSATIAQPAVDNSAVTARQKAIEAARKAAEQREAEAKVRRAQEAAAEAKAKAEAEAKAKIEAEARAAAEAKAKAEQAAAARRAERARAAAKARAAELEARLKAEQEAAARARAQAAAAEEKARQAQAQALELQQKAQASPTAPAVTASSVATSAKPTSSSAKNVDPELEFTTDPCQGPSARFLSTCRK